MKKIRNIGMSALMLMGVSNFALATSDVPFLEGVATFDNPGVAMVKISTESSFVLSSHLGMNSALAVLPKGFGINNSGESFLAGIIDTNRGREMISLQIGAFNGEVLPVVISMQFFNGGPTGSWTFTAIEDGGGSPFAPPPPVRTFGGIMFSSNVIAASAAALASGAEVRTEIGSALIYNSTTKTIETIDDVVVALTRL